MAFRRSIGPMDFSQVGKAGSKDPRGMAASRNDPARQPDIAQFTSLRAQLAQGVVRSYPEAHAAQVPFDGTVRTVPTRTEYVSWSNQSTGVPLFNPVLVVPKNLGRMSLLIANTVAANIVSFSFGVPARNASGNPIGIGLNGIASMEFGGVSCPVNDIFMWHNQIGTFDMTAWEAITAPEANVS